MQQENACNNFKIYSKDCSGVWSSLDAGDLLMDIIELDRKCSRGDITSCNKTNTDKVKEDEKSYWNCIDAFCGANSDKLVKGRKYFLDKMSDSFNKFQTLF